MKNTWIYCKKSASAALKKKYLKKKNTVIVFDPLMEDICKSFAPNSASSLTPSTTTQSHGVIEWSWFKGALKII